MLFTKPLSALLPVLTSPNHSILTWLIMQSIVVTDKNTDKNVYRIYEL